MKTCVDTHENCFARALLMRNKKNMYLIHTLYLDLRPASVAQFDAPSDWRPGGRGFNPAEVGNILS